MANVILPAHGGLVPPEGAGMTEAYEPPPWPRFLFRHGGPPQQFASQADADATGEQWHRSQAEADAAGQAPAPAEEPSESPTPRSRR
jgi:hypothetical protein